MPIKKEMVGKTFSDWFVLQETNKRKKHNETIYYLCKCKCGRIQMVDGYSLRAGISKYCLSCKNRKNSKNSFRYKSIRIYNIYQGMISRCYNTKNKSYKNYGGRGIKVCSEWLNNRMLFYEWAINSGYKDNLSIDRINNDGNYEPCNCRWATRQQQGNNTRQNRHITYKGKTMTLAEWARALNMSQAKLKYRLDNWDLEKAFTK